MVFRCIIVMQSTSNKMMRIDILVWPCARAKKKNCRSIENGFLSNSSNGAKKSLEVRKMYALRHTNYALCDSKRSLVIITFEDSESDY